MSQTYTDLGARYDVFSGTTKEMTTEFIDSVTGAPKDLSDLDIYDSIIAKIVKPNGEILGTITGSYSNRPNGIVSWTPTTAIINNGNAGNWIVEVILYNVDGDQIDAQIGNFNILELR